MLKFEKKDIPTFSGQRGEVVENFIFEYEKAARDYSWSNEERFCFLSFAFVKAAALWYWEEMKTCKSYDDVKKMLIKEFGYDYYAIRSQGKEEVFDRENYLQYVYATVQRIMLSQPDCSEEQKLRALFDGLPKNFKQRFHRDRPSTVEDFRRWLRKTIEEEEYDSPGQDLAVAIRTIMKDLDEIKRGKTEAMAQIPNQFKYRQQPANNQGFARLCYNCNRPGHIARDCRLGFNTGRYDRGYQPERFPLPHQAPMNRNQGNIQRYDTQRPGNYQNQIPCNHTEEAGRRNYDWRRGDQPPKVGNVMEDDNQGNEQLPPGWANRSQ